MADGSSAYGVSDEALSALRNLIKQLTQLQEDILKDAKSLKTVYQENSAGLGSHTQAIEQLLDMLVTAVEGNGAIKSLISKLTLSYNIRAQHRDNSVYGGPQKTK